MERTGKRKSSGLGAAAGGELGGVKVAEGTGMVEGAGVGGGGAKVRGMRRKGVVGRRDEDGGLSSEVFPNRVDPQC